jgi:hypothetical protein
MDDNGALIKLTETVARLDKTVSVIQVDVGYLKQRVEADEERERREAERLSQRRFTVGMAVFSTVLGAAAAVVMGVFSGGSNAGQ